MGQIANPCEGKKIY